MPAKQTPHPPPDPGPRPPAAGPAAWLWVAALAIALLLLGVDTARRLDALDRATETRLGSQPDPELDPDSPSGYRWNQHRLLLTQTDGYQWLLQTEQAIDRDAFRVHDAAYDNAPAGRAVHWAGAMRWWVQGLAGLRRLAAPELTAAQALERVAPWANAALLAAFLIVLTPLMAWRFGSLSAGLFATGGVTVFPFSDLFAVGYFDHHGLAATSCVAAVLLMLGGGAGWVRDERESGRPQHKVRDLGDWLTTRPAARRWIACSGITGAIGLWISAATTVPVLVGMWVGVWMGSFVGTRAPAGSRPAKSSWVLDPSLFRVWGAAGAVGSLFFYLVEYFPSDVGLRLEVNHPLYALALFGAGDLLARAVPGQGAEVDRRAPWLVADLSMVLALPAAILLTGGSAFRIADPFLWIAHDRYIAEFQDLRSWMLTRPPGTVVAELSLVPLVALPLAALLWPTTLSARWRLGWRALVLTLVAAAAAYAYVFLVSVTEGNEAIALLGAGGAVALFFVWPAFREARELPPPARSVVILAATPALVLLLMALTQLRWLGIAAALHLAALAVAVSLLLTVDHAFVRAAKGRVVGGALLLVALTLPAMFAGSRPMAPANSDAITRDASHWLRRRLGGERAVVLASPTATSLMIWFGGFSGIGTLYWENLEGLLASAEIHGARDPDSAHALLTGRGITHIALYDWDGGLEHLLFSAGSATEGVAPEEAQGTLHRVELELRHNRSVTLPPWLLPLPYIPRRVSGYGHPLVHLLEVVDEMPSEIALVRLARYYQALDDPRMDDALTRSLEIAPSVPALAMLAQQRWARGNRPAFLTTVEHLRAQLDEGAPLELEDRLEVAIALGLTGNREGISRHLGILLAEADEAQLRRLREERLSLLVDMSQELGLDRAYPEASGLARNLVPPP